MVQLRKLFHNGNDQIGIYFGFDENLKNKARSIGARWSQTKKCWYLLYNKENYKLIKRNFESIEIIKDKNNERQTEPALIKQEIVHIAEVISEIQPTIKAEHKGENPEIARKIIFTGSSGKYWILKVPFQQGITPKLMEIKGVYSVPYLIEQVKRWEGSRYSKANGAYLLSATPSMFENLQQISDELKIPIHNKLPARYLSKYKAMNKKELKFKNLRESLLLQVPATAETYTLAMIDYLMAQNYSANTIQNYVKSFNLFQRINYYQNPDTLTEIQIVRQLAGMTEKGLSASSLNMLVNALLYYFRTVLKRDTFEIKMPRPRR